MTASIQTFQFGKNLVSLETGRIARQATGSVLVSMADTCVLVAAVGKESESDEPKGFFPLTVQYQERYYSAGKIPGGFIKREGRPSERETLTSRLIDRPIRPLFPEGFESEVQITATVLSVCPEVSPDIPALLGASAALAISGMPFLGPIGAARVGYKAGDYLLNPSYAEIADSALDLVVAGTDKAVLMVESEADGLSEAEMLGAVMFGHQQMQVAIEAINALASGTGKPAWHFIPKRIDEALATSLATVIEPALTSAYQTHDKQVREQAIDACKKQVITHFEPQCDAGQYQVREVESAFKSLEKRIVRQRILAGEPRIDGRDNTSVRDIKAEVGVLPRTHGSALFTRGETQAMVVATLGTERDAQLIDGLEGESKENFMLHYNFPPYCVGELGMMTGPKRREIGHGKLAKRALEAVVPNLEHFPYVLRVVSEITESNGSSSMASVCGTSLALMDAGVPLKASVAGIAMGLIKDADNFAVLTDILGDEDHLGDMDFKVAGTRDGITALQMDIKIEGITEAIMQQALEQAKQARLHILDIMDKTLSTSRTGVSQFAPRILTMKVNPDKIRDIIGKGGATIRQITEETGTSIDISDDGVVKISAVDETASEAAKARITLITTDAEVGKVYDGTVVKIVDFGAFVNFLPGKDGLLHISQISQNRINNVSDVLAEGQAIRVKVLEIDRQGRIRLSMKAIESEASQV